MIQNAQEKVGADNLFIYSAQHRNCQHFITDLLKASGINNPSVIDFVKQDIQGLFENTGWLRKIANITTDLAGRFDVIKEGSGRKVQTIEELKQLPISEDNLDWVTKELNQLIDEEEVRQIKK